ncbi:MAG: hypothetical protein WD049_01350 [Candidatus Paceibacterota bacterium]
MSYEHSDQLQHTVDVMKGVDKPANRYELQLRMMWLYYQSRMSEQATEVDSDHIGHHEQAMADLWRKEGVAEIFRELVPENAPIEEIAETEDLLLAQLKSRHNTAE